MQKYLERFSPSQTITFRNGTQLTTPFVGEATQWTNDGKGFRAARLPAQRDTSTTLDAALEEMGFVEQETIHVDALYVPESANEALRSPSASEQVVLRPAAAADGSPQVVLYADEAGGLTWHLPDDFGITAAETAQRGRKCSFTIPTRTVPARRGLESGQVEMRGVVTAIGRKVLKVFVIPVVAKLLANPMERIVVAVEEKHSQNLIRVVNAANFNQKVDVPFGDWSSLAGKRSLLIVHGILSSTEGMLSRLAPDAMAELAKRYEGRVIAYDHFTLSLGPDANATNLLKRIKEALPEQTVNLDILCHSRGGIVSRAIVERGRQLVPDHNCSFGRVFFVATPNAGSSLGDAAHIVDMVDVFTNLLTKLPDGPAAYVIEAVLALIKLLVYSAESSLPGLAAMGTAVDGYIQKELNKGGATIPGVVYGAAAADYEPDPNSPHAFFAAALNAVVDRTFAVGAKAVANDLVVPFEGVHAANGSGMFPISDPLLFGPTEFVYHTDFFAQPKTLRRISELFYERMSQDRGVIEEPPERVNEGSQPDQDGGSSSRGGPRLPASRRFDVTDYADEVFRGGFRIRSTAEGEAGSDGRDTESASLPDLAPADGVGLPLQVILPETTLKREPQILFHERVTAGTPNKLTVSLTELAEQYPEASVTLEMALAAGQESVIVNVLLSAPGFDITPDSASLTVCRSRDPQKEQATYTLTARDVERPSLRAIHADFLLGTSVIGSVSHYTCVVPSGYDQPGLPCESQPARAHQGFAVPRKTRMECDWALAVAGEGSEYKISLTSRLPNSTFDFRPVGTLRLEESDMAKYLNEILTSEFSKFPRLVRGIDPVEYKQQIATWKGNFITTMTAMGKRLWQWLPSDLRTEYFDQYRAGTSPASILIHSDEMIFPWELLIPNETTAGKLTVLKPLGVAHVLGRWKPGLTTKPKEQLLRVRKFRVLNPDYPPPDTLPWAAEEAKELQQMFPTLVSLVKPADLTGVMKLFDESDVQVLHFSGHGEVNLNNSDLNKILLENETQFEALQLTATNLCNVSQPVIYMNACSVGNVGVTVGRSGGFASNFVTNGCSGVIAPLWPINDKSSMEFALALYRKLKLGRSVGEGLQELRDQNAQDPTYCAYTFFGDPWVRLNLAAS